MADSQLEKSSGAASEPEYSERELLQRFAAVLTTAEGRFQGMATLLSPSQAVTPFHVLRKARMLEKNAHGILVSMQGATRRFTVGKTDEEADLALLEMDEEKPVQGMIVRSIEAIPGDPVRRVRWISANGPDIRKLTYLEGIFTSLVQINKRRYLNLNITNPHTYSLEGISGAPVIIDGKLAGIAALEDPSERSLFAIPASVMLESQLSPVLREVLTKAESKEFTKRSNPSTLSPDVATSSVRDTDSVPKKGAPRWLTYEDLRWFSMSAWSVINEADEICRQYKSRRILIRHFLMALSDKYPKFLRMLYAAEMRPSDFLELMQGEDEGKEDEEKPPEVTGLSRLSADGHRVLTIAMYRAAQDRLPRVEIPHLLYGALSISTDRRVRELNAKGITPAQIDQFLVESETSPTTDVDVDSRVTENRVVLGTAAAAPDAVEGDAPSEKAQGKAVPKSFLARYNSDDAAGSDLLNITEEVNTLASVLAAKEVEPPLSLGLFGEWGTGKSFFMRMLEARIAGLSADAKKAESEGLTSAYCRNVRQITFNAWNYIDADLWASLAAEIFENLAAAITDERKSADSPEQRALALAAASSSRAVLEVAEQKKREAEIDLEKAEGKLIEFQKSKLEIEDQLSVGALVKHLFGYALENEEVRKSVADAKKTLGIDEASAASEQLRAEMLELDGIWKTLLFTAKNERRVWIWVLAPVAALVLAASAGELFQRLHARELMQDVATILGLAAGALAPFLAVSRKLMEAMSSARAKRNQLIDEMKSKRRAELETELDAVKKNLEATKDEVIEKQAEVKKLDDQLEAMRADRRMADYVLARHQSTDYTQKLGTISRVRSNLKRLSVLLREVKAESLAEFEKEIKDRQEKVDKERSENQLKPLFPRIDRIVLYIDDLDRCPEETVVKVLQAVHLLLAFPLFVVVVGVDPRWLLYSLKQSSGAFQNQQEANGETDAGEGEGHWHSTPMNYLEKIFQIPFTLRPIKRKGFQSMVDRYARSPVRWASSSRLSAAKLVQDDSVSKGAVSTGASQNTAPANAAAAGSPVGSVVAPSVEVERAQTSLSGTAASQTAPNQQAAAPGPIVSGTAADTNRATGPEAKLNPESTSMGHGAPLAEVEGDAKEQEIDRAPAYLSISDEECAFMKELHPFIPSPRAGKRFINIYRLLRASVKPEDLAAFEGNEKGGPYRSAMLLLAILTAYPNQAGEISLQLMGRTTSNENWSSFLMALDKFKREVWTTQSQLKDTTPLDARARDERGEWEAILVKAAGLQELVGERPIEEFVAWAPRVARYSFQSGRVLHYEHD